MVVALWLVTHAAAGAVFLGRFGTSPDRWPGALVGELTGYVTGIAQLGKAAPDRVLPELTGLEVRLVQGLVALTGGTSGALVLAVAVLAVLADLLVLAALVRSPRYGPTAAGFWAVAVPLLGPVAYARLDLLVVALVAVAWVLATRRPVWAAATLALATGLGVWPVLALLPLLALTAPGRRRAALLGYAAAGLPVVAVGLLTGGWARLASPVTSFLTRGMGIDSVPATPALLDVALGGRHTVGPAAGSAAGSVAGRVELRGPWVTGLLTTSTVLVALAVAITLVLGVVALRHRAVGGSVEPGGRAAQRERAVVGSLVAAAGVLAFLASGRTLAPETLLWAVPFLALLVARHSRRWPWVYLVLLLLTQVEHPYLVGQLAQPTNPAFDRTVALVAARNLGLIVLAGWALVAAARAVRDGRGAAPATGADGDDAAYRRRRPHPTTPV